MRVLFIHQNFPGQFRHVARAMADAGHTVVGLGDAANLKASQPLHPSVKVLGYRPHGGGQTRTHHYVRDFEGAVRRGQSVVRAAQELRQKGFVPDLVVAHPGWGEALFLRDVFPEARHIYYCEFFYSGYDADVGFDPEFGATLDDRLKVRVKNASQLISLVAMDSGISPTQWQKSRYPDEFQSRIEVLHEGIDTLAIKPNPTAEFRVGQQRFRPGDEVVTFVSRNLEPYRGIHVFLRALPALQRLRPNARVVLVGGDAVSYGRRLPEGQSYRDIYCKELEGKVDWSRVHFVGKLPYLEYLKVLQVSAVHVYLTYPFVLSWSLLEAMAAGCAIVASATPPVEEVITDGMNGRLVDFFDVESVAKTVARMLAATDRNRELRAAARSSVEERYDLRRVCLPAQLRFLYGSK